MAPGHTGLVRRAAPTPVTTPHARRQAFSSGRPSGTLMAWRASTIVRVVKVPVESTGLT